MGGFYTFDEAPDLLTAIRRGAASGVRVTAQSATKAYPEEEGVLSRIGGFPVGFQFGTYFGLKGPAAFLVDVFTDPTTYIPFFGILSKGIRGLAGLTKAGVAATAARDIAAGVAKHPAGAKLLRSLMDESVELGAKGLSVQDTIKNMKHGFQSAAAIAGNDEAQGLVRQAFDLHKQALTLAPGKAQRRAFNEVERIMSKARKIIRNDAGAGRLTAEVFSSRNLQGFQHAIRMRQDALLAPLGETLAEQAYRGQRKLLHGYMPFSELWSKTGAPQEVFSFTGAPLLGVADAVAGIARISTKPVRTGIRVLDEVARKALLGVQTVSKLTVTADDVVASANRAVEATTGRMFTNLRQQGNKLVAPGVMSASATSPGQVFLPGPEGKAISYLQATATDRIQAALHAHADPEIIADNFVGAIESGKFEVDRLTTEMRTLLQQVHGGGEAGSKLADARARLATLAFQSPVDEATGINGAGLIPTVTERVAENGIKVPLVQFERPGVEAAFQAGADLNLALDVAKGVDPAIVAKPFGDEELLLLNTMAEAQNRMGLELAHEGLKEEFVRIYGPRIVTMTPKGRAVYGKGLGKVSAAIGSAAEETSLPEELLGMVKSAFNFNPPAGSAGRSFLKERRASWDFLLKGERDGLWTLEHDALKAFNRYMKSAGEVIYKQGYLKSLRALGEDAFGRVVMNAKEVDEAGGLARLSVTGPTEFGAGVFKASKETTPIWRFVPADSIIGFNTDGQRYFIREDIHAVLDKLPQFKPGGLFLSSDPQTNKFVTGLLAINAMSKRTKVSLSQFHKFVLAGSLVSDQGLGLFYRKAFNAETGVLTKTLNLDVVKAAGIGAVKGAAGGAAVGAFVGDDAEQGAVGGALAAVLPAAAFASAKEFARLGPQIYGNAADIAITGIKNGLTLDIDDAGLTTLDRMVHTMGTTPIPRLTTGGARQRAFVRGAMQPVEYFDQNLWREFYPGAKVMAFGNLYAEAMAENVKRGFGMTADHVAANIAHHVNRAFGGQVWRRLGVSPHSHRMLNGMWFATDWTTANVLMARDVFVNLTPARTALVGGAAGVVADAVVNGFDPDDMTAKGAVASALKGAAGALAFRSLAFAFGHKIGKDIIRNTPLEAWMVKNTATLAEMRDFMGKATEAYKAKSGKALISVRDPEFASFAVDFTKKEMEKAGKFLPDEFIPASMKSGADALTAKYARRYAKNALIAMAVMGNVANYAMTGHFMWENKDGYRTDVQLNGQDSAGRNLYMSIGKQYIEPFEWVADPGKRLKGKISALAQVGIDLGSNEDFMGRPIIQMDGGLLTQGYEAGKYALTEMFTPIPVQPLVETLQGKKDIKPAVITALGLPTKTEFKRRGVARRSFKVPSLASPPSIGRTSLRPGEDF